MKPSRRLDVWIKKACRSRASVAAELGVCRSVITYWCSERQRPSLKSAKDIEFLTGGEIPLTAWGYGVDLTRQLPKGSRLLQAYILDHDLTVHALAQSLGKAPTTVRGWSLGIARPNEKNLARLSRLLKTKLKPEHF